MGHLGGGGFRQERDFGRSLRNCSYPSCNPIATANVRSACVISSQRLTDTFGSEGGEGPAWWIREKTWEGQNSTGATRRSRRDGNRDYPNNSEWEPVRSSVRTSPLLL